MKKYSEITPEIKRLAALCSENDKIDPGLFAQHNVKRGLRDLNGKGVLTGLTEISEIISYEKIDGVDHPCEGRLYYRGISIEELVRGFVDDDRFGFEEITYLLLFGCLPDSDALSEFNGVLSSYRSLPPSFVRDIIMKAPSKDLMNALARSVLTLYSYDEDADNASIENVLRQSLQLIAIFPLLAAYGYQTYRHYYGRKSLYIHTPKPGLSTAENFLRLLRADKKYTRLEAKTLDMALVLHAEHGGGNNSTFTTRVISSSGTDTYSVIAGALGSLKGPKHGGANIKVVEMISDIKKNVSDWKSDDEIADYLKKILRKEAFDHSGLIYGMGHAVYSLSDPRAELFKRYVEKLSAEKHADEEFDFYSRIERLAPEIIASERKIYKGVSANVDFYSGFVYNLLGLPPELFTPIFAMARISGWSAHRLEELNGGGKIIRPAYMGVEPHAEYIKLKDR